MKNHKIEFTETLFTLFIVYKSVGPPDPKVGQTIVYCLQFSHGPGPKSWSNHCLLFINQGGTPGPKSWSNHCFFVYWQKSRQTPPKNPGGPYCLLFIVPVEKIPNH